MTALNYGIYGSVDVYADDSHALDRAVKLIKMFYQTFQFDSAPEELLLSSVASVVGHRLGFLFRERSSGMEVYTDAWVLFATTDGEIRNPQRPHIPVDENRIVYFAVPRKLNYDFVDYIDYHRRPLADWSVPDYTTSPTQQDILDFRRILERRYSIPSVNRNGKHNLDKFAPMRPLREIVAPKWTIYVGVDQLNANRQMQWAMRNDAEVMSEELWLIPDRFWPVPKNRRTFEYFDGKGFHMLLTSGITGIITTDKTFGGDERIANVLAALDIEVVEC